MEPSTLFRDNTKSCKVCGRLLSETYPDELCPGCKENALFDQVREFVRAHDVTEYQVSEHFGIPMEKIKKWIREGRIEYKEQGNTAMTGMYCGRCGAPVTFGTLCPKCLKLMNGQKKGYSMENGKQVDAERMHFLDDGNK